MKARLLRLAILRRDLTAIAILSAGRRWTPEPDDYPMLTGLRWLRAVA